MRKFCIFFFLALYALIPVIADSENESLQIIFYPTEGKNISFVIFDNENNSFSHKLKENLKTAVVAHFPTLYKENCEEGFYKIIFTSNKISYVYEVFAKNIVYDSNKDKYLKYDALSDIYEFLARKQLNFLMSK